jgi:D-alanyl-lipoteichoic acid acyltransferase DltB (MBOAT superfamily)
LAAGVTANLLALGWFKYAGFLVGPILLPVGISFFTFTQIGYLVDRARGEAAEDAPGWRGALHYLLFVTWFPHLVAGPLLHHRRTIAQLRDPATYRLRHEAVAVGASAFLVGLFKKVVLADAIAPLADAAFAPGAASGLGAAGAWAGAAAYAMQIYFDFSGYSDMAIGLSRMFNVAIPLNFDSPYRACSIVAFWRRWHISLSAFLRDYVYIPLGGNRRHVGFNLMATMLLAGAWHGAGWNFVAWGVWHGALLVAAHRWGWPRGVAGWAATMLAVLLGWVLFRAPDLAAAGAYYRAMAGLDGLGMAPGVRDLLVLAGLGGIAVGLPNLRQMMAGEALALPAREGAPAAPLRWRPGVVWAGACAAMLGLSLLRMTEVSPFLYYQF